MRALTMILLAAALIFAAAGCGEKAAEQTTAIEVENPPEEKAPEPEAAPPMLPRQAREAPKVVTVTKDGWSVTESGLKYKDKKSGAGAPAGSGNTVTVHYKGWLDNGKVFDSSKKPGREPFSFTIDNDSVIQGWHQGLKGMKVGGVRELEIPANLGYGAEGREPVIPPNSTLHFEVELLKVN